MSHILITKADGEQEPFDPSKLEHSLQLAGASSTVRARVLAHVLKEIKSGMRTEDIYHRAFDLLKREDELPVAARYSTKRAIFALGPSGFPFEQFLAEVFRAHGWHARTGVAMTGRCAPHEVDVLAEKGVRKGRARISRAWSNSAQRPEARLPDSRDRMHDGRYPRCACRSLSP
jgi:hypothetical protein